MFRVEHESPSQVCIHIGPVEVHRHFIGNRWRDWRMFKPQCGKWWLWLFIPHHYDGMQYGKQQGWIGIGIAIGKEERDECAR